jgi:Nif-specific regulatory protein
MEKMIEYDWPGNVRELRNAIERAVVMGDGKSVSPDDLPIHGGAVGTRSGINVGMTLKDAIESFKRDFITMNLKNTGGNRGEAAKVMDIQRTYLSRLISKYGLQDL